MKIWVDDVRVAPQGYVWCKSVNETIKAILELEQNDSIDLIDLDHDAGEYVRDGGDYIKILDWLTEHERNYPIRIHSMNPVGVDNMRRIIQRNGWVEIK